MANQINVIDDLSTLLRIPAKVSNELVEKVCLCLGHIISEAKKQGETQVIINIGIGSLSINLIDMECKFVPGKNLKTAIKSALTVSADPLEIMLEQTFAEKLLSICEEVL